MLSFIVKILIQEIIGAVSKAVSDYLKLRQKKKEDVVKVKDALNVKDPKERAARVRDLLS